MYSSTFIFAKKQFDAEFHRLDAAIAEAAKSIPGYLGEESWENIASVLVSNVYYWESLEALQGLCSIQHTFKPKPVNRSGSMAIKLSSLRCCALTAIPSSPIH